MSDKMKSLAALIPDELKTSAYTSVKDVFGLTLELRSVITVKDDRGNKAMFACRIPGEEKEFTVTTRALQPRKVGNYLKVNHLYPALAKFVPRGQAVLLVDPSVEEPADVIEDTEY